MPLPTKESIGIRGTPLLGGKATIALSLTLTQKQVEAMFARQASINKLASQSATQFPLEIDFDKKKMYIGDVVTTFNSGKETAIREICKRSPSANKPLASLYLSAMVVGKLAIPRGLNDAAEDLRKATEAEQTKKNERGIVRIDTPITTSNGKKPRVSGTNSLAKQAMTNRIASTSRSTVSTPNNPVKVPSSRPSATSSTISGVKELDFSTLRSRLIHFIAALARPKDVAISEFLSASRIPDNEADVRKVFDQVAKEIPGPKNSDLSRWTWDLKPESWLEVRPFVFPDYTPDQRRQASRRARIGSGISPSHPVWEHFYTVVDSNALASAKAITAGGIGGGIYPNAKGKKAAAKPAVPKLKTASTSKPKIDDDGDMRPRKVLSTPEEIKPKPKNESTTTLGSSQPPLKPLKRLDDDIPSKLRVPSTTLKKEPSPRPLTSSDSSFKKRKATDVESEFASDMEEGELPSKEPKKRRIIGPPEASKKSDTSTVPKRMLPVEKEVPTSSKPSRDAPAAKAAATPRISTNKHEKQETTVKQGKERESKPDKTRIREYDDDWEKERDIGREKVREGERERERKPLEKGKNREKEKERTRVRERTNEEAIERVKTEKPLAVKHKRRATPSFSSSSSEENEETQPVKRITTNAIPRSSVTGSSVVKSNLSKAPKFASGPATLPNDIEGLRREYGVYYAQYLLVTSKFYEQKSRIENALALDTDSASVDDDSDILDSKELTELCEEYHRIRNELERIRKAESNLNNKVH